MISLTAPAIAVGNRAVVVPSEPCPLAATDFYRVLDASDLPDGVVNIVTGRKDPLAMSLAGHYGVDAIWYHGSIEGSANVERASAANVKRSWVNNGQQRDWLNCAKYDSREFLRRACQVKNIWIPYGD